MFSNGKFLGVLDDNYSRLYFWIKEISKTFSFVFSKNLKNIIKKDIYLKIKRKKGLLVYNNGFDFESEWQRNSNIFPLVAQLVC